MREGGGGKALGTVEGGRGGGGGLQAADDAVGQGQHHERFVARARSQVKFSGLPVVLRIGTSVH
jgi:hypothetical protein